ncbi:MAG: GNAT family N-acetyltransferase, partial [Anaerolineae bacterium]|nr:GNAT family N-acetyltransferase [Anaerolineae bacterium]
DVAAIARVSVDTWRTTYRGIMPDAVLDTLSYEHNEANWHRVLQNPQSKSFVKVAVSDHNEVIGFAAAGPERTGDFGIQGEIYALYVRQSAQRAGLGRGLVIAAATKLMARGYASMLIWVLRDNQIGRAFYERIGGLQVAEREIAIAEVMLPEIGYGWRDLALSLRQQFSQHD